MAAGRFFRDLKSELNTGLDTVAALLGDTTIGEITHGRLRLLPAPGTKRSPALTAALSGSPAQHNYVLSKMLSNLPDQPSPVIPGLPDGFAEKIAKAIDDMGAVQDGEQTVRDLTALCETLFRDPSRAGDIRVADLLAAFRDLIDLAVDCADILAVVLLEFAAAIIRGLLDVLTTPMTDVPVLSWLWEHVVRPDESDDPMTLGRILCLVLAAPVTLTCLMETGRGPYDASLTADAKAMSGVSALDDAKFYTSGLLIIIDMIADTINMEDAAAAMANPGSDGVSLKSVFFNALDVVANGVVQVLFSPEFAWKWDWSSMTRGARITNATWIGLWAPILSDGAFVLVDIITGSLTLAGKQVPAALKALNFQLNATIDYVLAVTLTGTGVAGAAYQLSDHDPGVSGLDVFEAIAQPLPWLGQILLLPEAVEETEGLSSFVQICLWDPIGDFDYDRLATS
ncbi:hypothetical protein [Nonomuraea sp. NPDC049750]|uniref:hypothetical protein n=1 Tax=Nonomuraea sp. NPDC049750 TaxID=3154738 RepID=UPI0033C73932